MTASLTNRRASLSLLISISFLLSIALPGCAHNRSAGPAFSSVPRPAGEIAIVNLAQQFVLVDIGRTNSPPAAEMELRALNPDGGETGRLRVTSERQYPFITADILSGTPQRGDQVYP